MAKSSGFKPLMLTEHFRCLPEIIEFSNSLSYNGRIKPLRDASNVLITPSVVEHRVPNGNKNSKKVNEAEVEHIVSIIQAMIEQEEYKDQTIGVISMIGSEQSAEIERRLQSIIDPVIFEERKIQCGTPPQFQGDERDIIILSLVDSPNEKGGPLRLLSEDGNNDKYRKRYNVAVSRARNQLWVVHSLNPEIDLKPEDLRLKLIKYAMNPQKDQEGLLALSESPFEKDVMKYLLDRSYKIIPQYKVGAYRIDMVLQYQDKKVALECDGERFHTIDNLENDMARQAILERLGWRFVRIRGSEYYRNSETTMLNVLSYLEKEGIYPTFEQSEDLSIKNSLLIASLKNKPANNRGEIEGSPKSIDKNDRGKYMYDFRERTGPVKTRAIDKKITNVSSDKGLSKPRFDFSDKK
jgi:very-short-patch-repair endonuclease